jgi:WD40 repeat protein
MPRTACLTSEELTALHLGDLPETALEDLAAHLEGCARCEAAARALDGLSDPVMAAFRQSALAGPLPAPEQAPPRVGEYEILGEVGRGGMGVVYRARHLQLQRTVALKMLLGGTFAHRDERARFRTEAEAVARLSHPHIVQIYEVGEHDAGAGLPRPYFTLEFAEGGNLSSRLAGRPQPPRQAAAWLEALARAAHYAHQQGIVHRDLKPSNVLLTAAGEPKICDFGVAKFLTGSDVKTLSGTLLGTAEFMAPEQALGTVEVGPAADIYALGAILYTALTGRPPFQGTSALHTLEQVRLQEPVPPRRLQPEVPRDLETICLKCLEKEPGRRYASALALADDLRRFLGDQPIKARRPSLGERWARWVRHHKVVAAALVVVTGTLVTAATVSTIAAVQKEAQRLKALAAEAAARAAQKRAEENSELATRNLYVAKTNLTGMTLDAPSGMHQVAQLLREWRGFKAREDPRGWEWFYCQTLAGRPQFTLRGHTADASALAWSPHGRRLASGGFDDTIRIWDTATGRQLLSFAVPGGMLSLVWSPQGRRLASANWFDRTIRVWDPATGKQVLSPLRHPDKVYSVAFSPDGRRLASADDGGRVIVWDAADGRRLFTLTGLGKGNSSVCWSPNGQRLATCAAAHAIKIWDGHTGRELRRLAGHPDRASSLRWSPDGRKLASAGWDGTVRVWDPTAGTLLRTMRGPLLEKFEPSLCWSPDSRRLAGACRDLAVRVWDAASGEECFTLWGHIGSRIGAVCWSPDGKRLASSDRGWNGEIKVWQLDARPELRTLVAGSGPEPFLEVCWSPDGRRLATAHKDGTVKTWDVDAGRLLATLRGHKGQVRTVRWSPDGRQLASGGSDTTVRLWDPHKGRPLGVFKGNGHAVASVGWSPDGKRLAWDTDDGTVTLWEAAGSPRRASFRGHWAAWKPKGSPLDQVAVADAYKIHIHDARTGAPISSWASSAFRKNWPLWSPDGRWIASIADYAVDVREAATGRPRFAPLPHTRRVGALAWGPDGKQLAVATDEDNRLHLWDATTGNPVLTLPGQGGPILSVAWSPDGRRLASSGEEGTIQIWDATRGYKIERAPALRETLDARLAARPQDRQALWLRAGVHARRGDWEKAAADADRLVKQGSRLAPGFFQAGWWVVDGAASPEPGVLPADLRDPFASGPDHSPPTPRWYLSADDPNGYVPLAPDPLYYLTRVYAPRDRQVELRLDRHKQLRARLWLNGTAVNGRGPTLVTLARGWNTLAVRIDDTSPPSNVLFHPRVGFYLRLNSPMKTSK